MKLKSLLLTLSASALLALSAQADESAHKGKAEQGQRPDPAKMFKKMDADQSGSLSLAEVGRQKRLAEQFAEIDADGNGELTQDEMKAHHQARSGEQGQKKGKGEKKGEQGEKQGKAKGGLKALDSDQSGGISQAEAENAPRLAEKFAAIDADGDGELSPKELQAHHKAHKGEKKGKGHDEQ